MFYQIYTENIRMKNAEYKILFNVRGSVHRNNILVYNSNQMHKLQILFYLTTALHVSGVTITHLQEHKTTVITASRNKAQVNKTPYFS